MYNMLIYYTIYIAIIRLRYLIVIFCFPNVLIKNFDHIFIHKIQKNFVIIHNSYM